MDERMKELIAVGISVGVHCQPCVDYHVGNARKMGISEEEIKEAVEVGYMVDKGAMHFTKKYLNSVLGQAQPQTDVVVK